MNIVDFFSTSFDDFAFSIFPKKAAGPGASEKPFGGMQGRPGGSGRASWEVLEGPGESGGRLGRVLGGLGAILERPFEQSDFGSIF